MFSRAENQRRKHFREEAEKTKREKLRQPRKTIAVEAEDDYFTRECTEIKANGKISAREKKRQINLAIQKEKRKKDMIAQLRKTPVAQLACERAGVSRSAYYKWRPQDPVFARAADRALEAGRSFINDLAESKLMGMIQNSNFKAIAFWLRHNNPRYAAIYRTIREYEVATERPSVEEENIASQEMAKLAAERMTPNIAPEELRDKLEAEMEEAERNSNHNKRLESFEED